MFRALSAAAVTLAVTLAGCRPQATAVDPNDPAITAIIDSLVRGAVAGAAAVDADRVLASAEGVSDLSLVTGDVILTGLDPIRKRFKTTYAGLKSQQQTISEQHIRVLSPDVAIAYAVGEGTYTDKAGWTSEPVGLGITLVFVKDNGRWRLRHAHQSIVH
jgi:uncharacterized protein (TIGR02246 family)